MEKPKLEEEQAAAMPVRFRGRAALRSIQVKRDKGYIVWIYNIYLHALQLSLPLFFLIMLSSPILLSIPFTGFFMLDIEGLYIPADDQRPESNHGIISSSWSWWNNNNSSSSSSLDQTPAGLTTAEMCFKVFIFSLSLSTTFGGTRVEARSPYALLLANLNTLMAQLIFVFLSGAVFHRLSQPREPVRWSKVALITNDMFSVAEARNQNNKGTANGETKDQTHQPGNSYKSFMLRLNLMDPKQVVLIECKFELTYRRFLTEKGNPAPFINHVSLKLVRPEVAYLKFGLVVRHIIDEESPLYGMDLEELNSRDASFTITISGIERSSMQPIFSENLYTVYDGEVLWDRQFQDQIITDRHGHSMFDCNLIDQLKPVK
ncbi:unnamed protein product [Sphagnum jensenii]|uniref:Inward rectifier potassium channel C-terminal domain-containing protein n=1 Tax=Sphagnum jensenii TaxID=128206 RepID=A0ABP0ZZP6_9BRYO